MSASLSSLPKAYEFRDFRLDPRARTLLRNGAPVTLTPKVFDTLLLLVRHPGQIVTKEQALRTIWPDTVVEESNLSQNVFLLRKILGEKEAGQKFILTRAGVGYSFLLEVREVQDETPDIQPATRTRRRWLTVVLAAAVLIAIASTVTFSRRLAAPSNRKWAVGTRPGVESFPAISPDGSKLAFSWDGGAQSGQTALYVQDLPGADAPLMTAVRLTRDETESASCPAWSPDGLRIAFVKQGHQNVGIYLISSDGTGERKIRDLHPAAVGYLGCLVTFAPDGRSLVIASTASEPRSNLSLIPLNGGAEETLVSAPLGDHGGDATPVYSPDGLHLAFVRREFRGSMDLYSAATSESGRLIGSPRKLTQLRLPIHGLAWAPDSQSLVYSATRLGSVALWRVRLDGSAPEPVPGGDQGRFPAISRKGEVLSFAVENQNINLWRIPLESGGDVAGQPSQLLSSTRRDEGPVFSRNGNMLSFFSDRTGSYEIWTSDASGGAARALTSFGGAFAGLTDWSPDGRTIVFDVVTPKGSQDIYSIPSAGGKPEPLIAGPAREATPVFSRDGRRIYFSSDRTGIFQVWSADRNGRNAFQLTKGGGLRPQEGSDGYLYYASQASAPEIRRIRLTGGEEEPVLTNPRPRFFGHWAIFGSRIYLIGQTHDSLGSGPRPLELWLYDIATRAGRKLIDLPRAPQQTPALTVAPDGSSLVFSRIDSTSGDLYVINKFR